MTDKLYIDVNGNELASLEPNLEQHGDAVGGRIICRNWNGKIVLELKGGSDEGDVALGSGGGHIVIHDGPLSIKNYLGQDRVIIHPGDANEDGGTILLNAADDTDVKADGTGNAYAIVLNASKRSIMINKPDGQTMVSLGPRGNLFLGGGGSDGDVVLIDRVGKERVKLGADGASIQILNRSGEQIVGLNQYGNLQLGGGKQDGDIALYSGEGKARITMGADGMKLLIKNDSEQLVELGGATGKLKIKGGIRAEGSIATNGNLIHRQITERSRQIGLNQHHDLFSLNQRGAFVISLASSYITTAYNGDILCNSKSSTFRVFTFEQPCANIPEGYLLDGDVVFSVDGDGGPLPEELDISKLVGIEKVGQNMRLTIGHNNKFQDMGYSEPSFTGTVHVTALYGKLLDF